MAVTGSSLRAACTSRVGRGTMGTCRPIARPNPNETPTRSPVKEPGPVATATLVTGWERTSCLSSSRSRRGMASSRVESTSSVATIVRLGDELSMTKIMLRPDQAAVAAKVLDLDVRRAVDDDALPPLDDHGSLVGELVDAELRQLGAVLDPVEVDVSQLHPTWVDTDQLERRARDAGGRAGA